MPAANTGARSTVAAFDKCYFNSGTCAVDGVIDSVTWDDGTGAAALPGWITFTSSGTLTQTVSITPADGTVIGTHSLIAVFNPTYGSDKTYTALTFTVGCEITSFTISGEPATQTYDVFTSRTILSMTSVVYTQVPACGYLFTSSYGHTITGSTETAILFAGSVVVPSFEIYSTTLTQEGSYSVSLTNAITVTSAG